MRMLMVPMCVAVAGVMLCASGCGRAREKMASKIMEKSIELQTGKKTSVDISNQKVTLKTAEGETVVSGGGSASIPAEFPKDIYVDKSAKVRMAMRNPGGFALTLETDQTVEKVVEKYAGEMKAQGWTQESSVDMGAQKMLAFRKEKRQVSLMVAKSDKATQVVVTVAEDKG